MSPQMVTFVSRKCVSRKKIDPPPPNPSSTDTQVSLVAMALAGYDGGSGLWKETCHGLKDVVAEPYLRAAFSFLCSPGNNFADVLETKGPSMSLTDQRKENAARK